jgi:hypothetical protein
MERSIDSAGLSAKEKGRKKTSKGNNFSESIKLLV